MRIRKTPSQNATGLSIFYSVALGTPAISKLAAPSTIIPSLCSATLPFLHRIQARRHQTSRDAPSFGPFLSMSNSHHFPFVREVRRYFNPRSRHPFSHRRHLAFSRKATSPNPCICAFAKSTYALRASFDARSAPDRLSRSINPRQRRRQHADKALWLARFPVCQFDKKRDNQPKKGTYHE